MACREARRYTFGRRMCIRSIPVRIRTCIPRRSIQVRTPNVYPPATRSEPKLYPAQVDIRSGPKSVSASPPAALPSAPPPRAATAPNVKKPGLRPSVTKRRASFPLRQRRQRVKFHRFDGYRPRSQPPPPRKERPATRSRARSKQEARTRARAPCG